MGFIIGYITMKSISDYENINSLNPLYKIKQFQKEFMKTRSESDDNLPLNKMLKLHNLTIVTRSAFQEDGKYYPQIFLDECFYEV